ncbi:hypothetical protein GQ44DRAFT_734243 [Phaeosphaeriaceae sp. PMI808]|nr:hypothetical protein GQ44DRAFT_734243 [Phaeosphaeriaceae sp. PMI808]
MSLPESIVSWDPVAVLSINQNLDGHITCAGVRNRTTTPCGWHHDETKALQIDAWLKRISNMSPRSILLEIETFAKLCLCDHHKRQVGVKVREWTAAINRLSSSDQEGLTVSGCQIASSPRLALNHQPIPGSTVSAWVPDPLDHFQHNDKRIITLQATVATLQEDIKKLMVRTSVLELAHPEKGTVSSSQKRSVRVRLLDLLRTLFRRNRQQGASLKSENKGE